MSLYKRLGGVYHIASMVDDLIDRIMNDPRLNTNPKVSEAHHKVVRVGLKYLVTERMCEVTGGPQHNTGRSVYDAHTRLDITEREWQALLDDLRQTLTKFKVSKAEQTELLAIVESSKESIVLPKTEGKS